MRFLSPLDRSELAEVLEISIRGRRTSTVSSAPGQFCSSVLRQRLQTPSRIGFGHA